MKALTQVELSQIVSQLKNWLGCQLQEVRQTATGFGLAFYCQMERCIKWLWFDLNPRSPMILCFQDRPPVQNKITKPLLLFSRAHFVGRRLIDVQYDASWGRVLHFHFSSHDQSEENDGQVSLEIRLYPHGQNLILKAHGKQVSWRPVAEIQHVSHNHNIEDSVASESAVATSQQQMEQVRSWEEIQAEWKNGNAFGAQHENKSNNKAEKKGGQISNLKKLGSARERLLQDIAKRESEESNWRQAGEWLKGQYSTAEFAIPEISEIPESLQRYFNTKENLAWNVENCFRKSKDIREKIKRAHMRLNDLEKELQVAKERQAAGGAVQTDNVDERQQKGAQSSRSMQNLLQKVKARGRTLSLGPDLQIYIGKSAADNLALLRKAQAHDFWLHIKDQPGAHAIIHRHRTRQVSDEELQHIGKWFIRETLGNTRLKDEKFWDGYRFEILLVECRYVRPIKGDRLGRVHYTNDRLLVVKWNKQ